MKFSRDEMRAVMAEAACAPSVHNVQPARWRFAGEDLYLFEDIRRRIPFGDPTGRDTGVSLGSATEGMAIALSARGYAIEVNDTAKDPGVVPEYLKLVRTFKCVPHPQTDPLYPQLTTRYSHRGDFQKTTPADREDVQSLAEPDLAVISDVATLTQIGQIYDAASLRFFRDPAFRAELVSWMRLSSAHPLWARDGLNAHAMAMSRFEAMGAGIVLGPRAFPIFDRLGLAGPLTGEAARVTGSTGVLLLHRAVDEEPFITGRVFHRHWLRLVAAGFQGAVMTALADDAVAQAMVSARIGLPASRRLVTTLRLGRVAGPRPERARLSPDELLV